MIDKFMLEMKEIYRFDDHLSKKLNSFPVILIRFACAILHTVLSHDRVSGWRTV